MTRKLITDNPSLTGYLDGSNAVATGSRNSREDALPDNQKNEYRDGFRRGAKHSAEDEIAARLAELEKSGNRDDCDDYEF